MSGCAHHTTSATLAPPARSTFAEQRTATDHSPGEPVAVASETAAQLVETNATERHHIASSKTRSGYRRFAIGKYYMRVGDAHPRHAHRGGIRSCQNADRRYGSWNSRISIRSGEAAALKLHANAVNCTMEI